LKSVSSNLVTLTKTSLDLNKQKNSLKVKSEYLYRFAYITTQQVLWIIYPFK